MTLTNPRQSSRWGIAEELAFLAALMSFLATVTIGVIGTATGNDTLLTLAGVMAALVSTCVVIWLCLRAERLRAET
ncbi:hypothetical protein ACFWQ6_27605 [Streptomyces coelicoflavus]|uniref:hypothetical protein n=1 Tax=Streptomyces coelicoflavus TaxID=285562 RepID=UPI003652D601